MKLLNRLRELRYQHTHASSHDEDKRVYEVMGIGAVNANDVVRLNSEVIHYQQITEVKEAFSCV